MFRVRFVHSLIVLIVRFTVGYLLVHRQSSRGEAREILRRADPAI
jgi:hypothetical protein